METIEIDGKQVPVTSHTEDGVPVVRGYPTTIHHIGEDGKQIYDEDGNPKISVHISVSPPQESTKE